MTPERQLELQSLLNRAVKEMAEELSAGLSVPVAISGDGGSIEVRFVGGDREILVTTEDHEITLVFGYSHLHAFRFYEEDLRESVDYIASMVTGLVRGDWVSYAVFDGDRPLGGGFSLRGEISQIGVQETWAGRWRQIRVSAWNPAHDRTIEATC